MKKSMALLLCGVCGLVLAAIVSASDIVDAIRNSTSANAWLKQNAQSVAQLAINVESGGNTSAYNGSCCYGVLQMNRSNIAHYAQVTPEQYRQLELQQQINAWAALTTDAMRSSAVTNLLALGTFDGRPVDGNLVLACVQLGIGNCQRMINSGKCSGFADSNGTTICSMADRLSGTAPGAPAGNPTSPQPGGSLNGGSASLLGGYSPAPSCVRAADGACMPITQSMQQGFSQGSGVEMGRLKLHLQLIGVAAVAVVMAASMGGLWSQFSRGRLSTAELKSYLVKGGIAMSMVVGVMTWL